MKTYRITCKRKHAQYERVEAIGCVDPATGAEERFTEDEAILQIESGVAGFVVRDSQGREASVEVEQRDGRKFLITRADGIKSDNLLAMPDCVTKAVPSPIHYRPVQPAGSHAAHSNPKRYS